MLKIHGSKHHNENELFHGCPIDVCIIIAHEVVVVDAFVDGIFGCVQYFACHLVKEFSSTLLMMLCFHVFPQCKVHAQNMRTYAILMRSPMTFSSLN
jgi:hypothetical protein